MTALPLALISVIFLCVIFWTTRTTRQKVKKWTIRGIGMLLVPVLASILASEPAEAGVAGTYLGYLGVPAMILYLIADRFSK